MNRREIIDSLKFLKEKNGAIAVKAEFEAEGSRKDELIMLREFVYQADLEFVIKIGGCEAIHDLDQCKLLDVTGVMAPMIETSFAMSKFKNAALHVYGDSVGCIDWIINAETKTCLDNIDSILEEGKNFLKGITVGRSDLSASMGVSKENIESNIVFEATKYLLCKASEYNLVCNFGGNIGINSISFINNLENIANRFETRKVIIQNYNAVDKKEAIIKALDFEVKYLKFKSEYYNSMATEDILRITRLEKELHNYN